MRWFTGACPVVPAERAWIDDNLLWFLEQFGVEWLRAPVVLPTDDFFPGEYSATEQDVLATVERVCGYMEVDPDRIRTEFHDAGGLAAEAALAAGAVSRWSGAAGHYRVVDGAVVISLERSMARRPLELVATIAHELAHDRLIGEGRTARDRGDQEPLTDLLTVFLGIGVLTANAALEFWSDHRARYWSTSRHGYLTEPMFGYALARYAWLRREPDPPWARHLDTNPRTFLRRGLRYLAGARVPAGPPADTRP
jgi:hypothetical protein